MVEVDPATGARSLIDKKMAEELHGEALMLYRPLPPGAKKVRDLLGYLFPTISGDVLRMFGIGFVSALLGLAIPLFSGLLVENIIPRADLQTHTLMICALVVVAFGSAVFELVKAMALFRIESKSDSLLQAAIFDRVLQLPVAILRKYTAGDLTDRALGVQTIRATLTGSTLQSMLSVVFSVISLGLLFYYSWKLALVAVGISVAGMGLMIWLGLRQLSHERERIRHQGQAEGLVVQILTGISKLRVAAAESRAFARWSNFFSQQKKCFVLAQRFANLQELFQAVLPVLAAAIIFWATSSFIEADAIAQQLRSLVGGGASSDFFSTGDFVAFNAAFGQFLAAMTGFGIALTKGLSAIPMLERLSPILESEPEMATEAKAVEKLKGGIEIAQVQFRYAPKAPLILDELSLNIHPNEFVALVGPSGSGKSTLMRLLLGFEKPEAGDVLLDGIPLSSLDLTSVRQQMRVVLQQGRISNGSIFENIVGNSTLTLDDAWAAAKLAGFDEDIESMPMGMHTVLVEGVNTLSGGQRQRLMIARALVHRPNILLLDEPTSALDNHTQETVMKSLGEFKATRILIAHRLSTVRFVDRIVVMNQGKLAEQGTFDELMAMNGLFTEMARRQQL
jgi:ATP-binding cassette subfamily C protein